MHLHVDPEQAPPGEILQREIAQVRVARRRHPELKPASLVSHFTTVAVVRRDTQIAASEHRQDTCAGNAFRWNSKPSKTHAHGCSVQAEPSEHWETSRRVYFHVEWPDKDDRDSDMLEFCKYDG